MSMWTAEPAAPASSLQSLFAREYAPSRVSEAGQAWRGYEAAILAPPTARAAHGLPRLVGSGA